MKLLSRIRRRPEKSEAMPPVPEARCLHTTLTAHWDVPSEMGDEEKASGWVCAVCGGAFTPEEARQLRSSEAERVKQALHAD